MELVQSTIRDESIHLNNSADANILEFVLYGKATQDGEPTLENPIDINVAGEDGIIKVKSENEYGTQSISANIITPNGLANIGDVYDEVIKYADGTGKKIQRIGKKRLTADMVFSKSTETKVDRYILVVDPMWEIDSQYLYVGFCSFASVTNTSKDYTLGKFFYNIGQGYGFTRMEVNFAEYGTTTIDDFKEFINSGEYYCLYVLPYEIVTDLTAEEIADIEKLRTFYPITNISNNYYCEMSVTYQSLNYGWLTPKTDWKSTDRFNFVDFNRIKNNFLFLHEKAQKLWHTFQIENMGEDILSYEAYWEVSKFNAFEKNLESINKNIFTQNYGYSKTFFENAPFIKYDELNRIESAILSMYKILQNQETALRKIPFRLGAYKEVRI